MALTLKQNSTGKTWTSNKDKVEEKAPVVSTGVSGVNSGASSGGNTALTQKQWKSPSGKLTLTQKAPTVSAPITTKPVTV